MNLETAIQENLHLLSSCQGDWCQKCLVHILSSEALSPNNNYVGGCKFFAVQKMANDKKVLNIVVCHFMVTEV